MNDIRAELVENIYKIYKFCGFVKESEILDITSEANISLLDTNWITETLLSRGIIIRHDDTYNSDGIEYDASRIEYNSVFDRVVANSPELKTLIEYVRKIQPPQYHEWITLMPQAQNRNMWAYNRLFEMNLRVVVKVALAFSEKFHVTLADAIQNGCLGLMYAIDKFDQSEFNSFPGYISRPIVTHIRRFADFPYSPPFYFPQSHQDNLYKILELV
jgi:DNA-directed RNA polymerase sigma subunit (sigma70/sigma32)